MNKEVQICVKMIKSNINNLDASNLSLFFGKKGMKNNERYYTFQEGMKNYKVSDKLLSFLKDNLKTLTESTIKDDFNENEPNNYIYFDLEKINVWNQFEPVIYKDITKFKDVDDKEIKRCNKNFREVKSLKKLKYQINHYLLIYEAEDYILGQISKIYPKQVFHESKLRFLFENEKFTEITSEKNIEIDEHDSVLFFINKDIKIGFTKNKKEYENIFDMDVQYKLDALNTIKNSDFKEYCNIKKVNKIIKKDLTIQRMLHNSVTKNAFENFDINKMKKSYNIIKDEKEFNFKLEKNKFIIDNKNERESLRHIIKFIGLYYNVSLDGDMIIEGIPKNTYMLKSKNNDSD